VCARKKIKLCQDEIKTKTKTRLAVLPKKKNKRRAELFYFPSIVFLVVWRRQTVFVEQLKIEDGNVTHGPHPLSVLLLLLRPSNIYWYIKFNSQTGRQATRI
jgi:hypothetical protein